MSKSLWKIKVCWSLSKICTQGSVISWSGYPLHSSVCSVPSMFWSLQTHIEGMCGCAALLPPGGEARYQPLLRGALAQLKMATGVLQRVSGGLGRAKSGAHSAGQLAVWGRWGSLHRECSTVLSVVSCVSCVVFSVGICWWLRVAR